MFGSVVLEVAIGLGFIYLILSVMSSAVQELVAQLFSLRSKTLSKGIGKMLEDPNVKDAAAKLYQHPLIKNLAKEGQKPSYIPARNFAVALLDLLKDPTAKGGPIPEFRSAIAQLPSGSLRSTLLSVVSDTSSDIEDVRNQVEQWFDDTMDRVSGWYKRTARWISLGIAVVFAVALNVNTVTVADALWSNPTLRTEYAALAERQASQDLSALQSRRITELSTELETLPIGWPSSENIAVTILGWLLTAMAVSLGAPFWFDMLGKLINLRSSGAAPPKSRPRQT